MPIGAKNVTYLEKKWCVYVDDGESGYKVPANMDYACANGDCTSLKHEGPCSKIDKTSQVSYAFNMLFQIMYQDVEACDFDGLAKIVEKNASVGNCLFPIALDADSAWRAGTEVQSTVLVGLLLSLLLMFFEL